MFPPRATYRIQFNLNFRFRDAEELVPYLHALGITHLYASPRFRARKGSLHGYDVADAGRVNSELGTEEEFQSLVNRLHNYGMGLLHQDWRERNEHIPRGRNVRGYGAAA